MIEIKNLRLTPDCGDGDLKAAAAAKLNISPECITELKLLRRSVDARRKTVTLVLSVAVEAVGSFDKLIENDPDVSMYAPTRIPEIKHFESAPKLRPVVCGSGPAGLFAALELALCGAAPILIERGADVDKRAELVNRFVLTGVLDTDTNIQFGEGGAGTFSDGKLNTGTHDVRKEHVLRTFVEAGAPEEILWQAKPHIGTDLLPGVVKNIRKRIEALGGEVYFETRLEDIIIENGALRGVRAVRNGERIEIETDKLILATGHSARDVFRMLYDRGARLEQKAFSIGLRIEHRQRDIDRSRYGSWAGHPNLGAADYKLSCHLSSGRSVYSFCMCPGGTVAAASSELGHLTVNGMSNFHRDGENANSAMLANVTPSDFGSSHPLAGIEFQRKWEKAAFLLGGEDYTAPAQLLGDFIKGVPSSGPGRVNPTYPKGVRWCDVSKCLPGFAANALREAAPIFARSLPGYDVPDAVLTGVEARSSSPVRILRDERCMSNIIGLFPCGEGAGYAGGIMSAAVDGLRVADAVIERMREEKNI